VTQNVTQFDVFYISKLKKRWYIGHAGVAELADATDSKASHMKII